MGLFSHFFEDYFEVGQGSEWVVRVLVAITNPFQDRAKHSMLEHPTRNTFCSVTPKCWLYHDTYQGVVTRYELFCEVVRNMRITLKIPRLGRRKIKKCSVNYGKCAQSK